MGNSLAPHLENAQKTGVCNLSKMDLHQLPEELKDLGKNLRVLDASLNKLSSLPAYMSTFGQIKTLNVNHNRLTSLPSEIGSMHRLETLLAEHNGIVSLPPTINILQALRHVSLAYNNLHVFPIELCGLKTLDYVDLSHNKLVEVLESVKELNAIEINLNQNQISRLSESIADCPRLKVLRLEENCLALGSFTARILRDSRISLLAVEGNVFDTKNFQALDGYDVWHHDMISIDDDGLPKMPYCSDWTD